MLFLPQEVQLLSLKFLSQNEQIPLRRLSRLFDRLVVTELAPKWHLIFSGTKLADLQTEDMPHPVLFVVQGQGLCSRVSLGG